MSAYKYTLPVLAPVVARNTSYLGIISDFGLKPTGGSYANFQRLVAEYGLDTSHFRGQGWNGGGRAHNRKEAAAILVVYAPPQVPPKAALLRRALLEIGRVHRCEDCDLGPEWHGSSLVLEIDHISGDRYDNEPNNLRFLCPNCHSVRTCVGSPTAEATV